jgi:hypothetical protein
VVQKCAYSMYLELWFCIATSCSPLKRLQYQARFGSRFDDVSLPRSSELQVMVCLCCDETSKSPIVFHVTNHVYYCCIMLHEPAGFSFVSFLSLKDESDRRVA